MIRRYLICFSSWIYLTQGLPVKFHTVQFLKPEATSFTTRTDHFLASSKIPNLSRRHIGIEDFFSAELPPIDTNFHSWSSGHDVFQPSFNNFNHFSSHVTPDFSNGLSFPDPFLRTGIQAKRMASYLYSKELFFDDIPHVKSLLFNQEERKKNGLTPHSLGSLRLNSPWNRFKGKNHFGGINSLFSF